MDQQTESITVETIISLPVEKVWQCWTTASDIMQWNNPNDDWHTPKVEIDLKKDGDFLFRMETKDGSMGFDHAGKYDQVIVNERIEYTGNDGRKSVIIFRPDGNETKLTESFEPDPNIPLNDQRDFCKGVIDNFKRYAETKMK